MKHLLHVLLSLTHLGLCSFAPEYEHVDIIINPCILTSLNKTEQESLGKEECVMHISDMEEVYVHLPSWMMISQ